MEPKGLIYRGRKHQYSLLQHTGLTIVSANIGGWRGWLIVSTE